MYCIVCKRQLSSLPVITQLFRLQLFSFSAKADSTFHLLILSSKDICKELVMNQEIKTVYRTGTTNSISVEVLVYFKLLTTWKPVRHYIYHNLL